MESFQTASEQLARFKTMPEVAEAGLGLALDLTSSAVAFIALVDETGQRRQLFSRAAETQAVSEDEIERIFAAAAEQSPSISGTWTGGPTGSPLRSYSGQPLIAGGQMIGMIGVASPTGYTATQQGSLAVLASQVAAAMAIAQLNGRRQEMVDTLINLRADLDRSEKNRLISEERAKSAERVERAQEASVAALLAVSRHARSGQNLGDFYRLLTESIAELVGATKVLFWQLTEESTLIPLAGAHGIDEEFIKRLYPAPCAPESDDLTSRVVFHDFVFRASRTDADADSRRVLDVLGVSDAISVAWRAGDQRLGLVAAYDCRRREGFSREDTWVLQKAGLAAGLVWQLKYAETDLQKTVERLQKVDTARQLLLRNVSTAVDKARKRFAGELHDDALQKLTAAEIQLQRVRDPALDGQNSQLLSEAQDLLSQTEDALRRLLFEVRPPTLEVPGGLEEAIRERIKILKALTGAEVELEIELPDDMAYESKSMVFRQITEALTNVEKHASASRVRVAVKAADAGIHGIVADNGRGFVVSERNRLPGHLGLLALNERALLAGGWNRIDSEPGMGTTVEFWLPVSDEKV